MRIQIETGRMAARGRFSWSCATLLGIVLLAPAAYAIGAGVPALEGTGPRQFDHDPGLLTGEGRPDAAVDLFTAQLDRQLPQLLDRYAVPGAAIGMIRNGQVSWTRGYGVADHGTQAPVTADVVFQAGSISKSLTGWGIMVLVERGEIDLDAPVEHYLTRWQLPPSPYPTEDVTVERLLSHTAGLPSAIHGLPTSSEELPVGRLDRDLFGVEYEPGTGFRYSNPGYVVLELLVVEVSGRNFADFMEAEVLRPLGMRDSSFRLRADLGQRVTTGHTFAGEAVPPDIEAPAAAGGLYTTAADLARFVAAATDGGTDMPPGRGVLRSGSVTRMHTPVAATEGLPHALLFEGSGLGHFVEALPGGQRAVGHGGESEGWVSGYFVFPGTGDGLVLLTNSRRSYHLIAQVVQLWIEWADLSSLRFTRTYARLTTLVWAAIGVFAAGSGWLAWRLARGLLHGTHHFAPRSRRGWPTRVLQAGLALALLSLWWGPGQGVVPRFLPVLAGWLGIWLTAFSTLLLLAAMVARSRPCHGGSSARALKRHHGTA